MEPNPYEAPEHPSGPMEGKRQFPSGYSFLERFWIAVAIALTGYILLFYLLMRLAEHHVFTAVENQVDSVLSVLAVLAFFVDLFVVPTAIGGLFGRIGMGVGAVCGFALLVFMAFSRGL